MTIEMSAATEGIPARRALPTMRIRPVLSVSIVFVVLVLVAAAFPGVIAADPNTTDPANALAGPSSQHLFGTDQLGRDIYDRVIWGTRTSIVLGIGAVTLASVVGALWGLLAAMGGRLADETLMRLADVLMSFPPILMSLLIVALLGPGQRNVIIAIAAAALPGFARLVRVQAMAIRNAPFIQAATALGVSRPRIICRHIIPNVAGPLTVVATTQIGGAIVAGASLSFLGLGTQPPAPEWGSMLSQSRDYLQNSWAMIAFPGLAVVLTIAALSVVGRELQLRFEGRQK